MLEEEKEYFMNEAIKEAVKARDIDEVPIGAVVVKNNEIIGRGHNLRETTQDSTAHAEMLAIRDANEKLGNWRLEDCEMFVTLEPCMMCGGAMVLSRLKKVYYGPVDQKSGAAGTLMNVLNVEKLNHQVEVESGLLEEDCRHLLTSFFKDLRAKKKQRKKEMKDT